LATGLDSKGRAEVSDHARFPDSDWRFPIANCRY